MLGCDSQRCAGGSERLLAGHLRRRSLLGQKDCLDVWQDTTLGDRDAGQKLVQLLVVTDGQLQVTRDDSRLLVVTGSVTGQLENLGGQVLHDGGQVDWGAGTDALGVVTLAEQTVDSADRELESSTAGPALCLSLNFASLSASRHCVLRVRAKCERVKTMIWLLSAKRPSYTLTRAGSGGHVTSRADKQQRQLVCDWSASHSAAARLDRSRGAVSGAHCLLSVLK